MPASVSITADTRAEDGVISLGEIFARDRLGEGEPVKISGVNDGTVALRELAVRVEGEGAEFVQLAIDDSGPGVWAAPGESVVIAGGDTVFPGTEFSFWARAIYDPEQLEGHKDFDFVIDGVSIG